MKTPQIIVLLLIIVILSKRDAAKDSLGFEKEGGALTRIFQINAFWPEFNHLKS